MLVVGFLRELELEYRCYEGDKGLCLRGLAQSSRRQIVFVLANLFILCLFVHIVIDLKQKIKLALDHVDQEVAQRYEVVAPANRTEVHCMLAAECQIANEVKPLLQFDVAAIAVEVRGG